MYAFCCCILGNRVLWKLMSSFLRVNTCFDRLYAIGQKLLQRGAAIKPIKRDCETLGGKEKHSPAGGLIDPSSTSANVLPHVSWRSFSLKRRNNATSPKPNSK